MNLGDLLRAHGRTGRWTERDETNELARITALNDFVRAEARALRHSYYDAQMVLERTSSKETAAE
jgi:hypothetical protein